MYIVLEVQTTDGSTSVLPVIKKATKNEAMSAFHSIMAAAEISSVEYHTAVVMDEQGRYLARDCCIHPQEPIEQGGEN